MAAGWFADLEPLASASGSDATAAKAQRGPSGDGYEDDMAGNDNNGDNDEDLDDFVTRAPRQSARECVSCVRASRKHEG